MEIIDINRYSSPLFLDDMSPLEIQLSASEVTTGITFTLERPSGEEFSESYLGDFDDKVIIDLRTLISGDFSYSIPEVGTEIRQSSAKRRYSVAVTSPAGASRTVTLDVFACSEQAEEAVTDIDMMRIPEDYILPLSCLSDGAHSGVDFILSDGTTQTVEYLAGTTGEKAIISRLMRLSATPAAASNSFRVKLRGRDIYSPQYKVCKGSFEQYLFLNRFGCFDNIAMSGNLDLQADTSHELGTLGGKDIQKDSRSTKKWLQHSGYMSMKTVEAFASLICSSLIYHLKDGAWKRIVIVESDVQASLAEDLHSFSFKYKYTDSDYAAYRSFT